MRPGVNCHDMKCLNRTTQRLIVPWVSHPRNVPQPILPRIFCFGGAQKHMAHRARRARRTHQKASHGRLMTSYKVHDLPPPMLISPQNCPSATLLLIILQARLCRRAAVCARPGIAQGVMVAVMNCYYFEDAMGECRSLLL